MTLSPSIYLTVVMRVIFTILFVIFAATAFCQVRISGTVYDISKSIPLPLVSVMTTSGAGTVTDSMGHYSIMVNPTDSIYFSYLNKPTTKFSVKSIPNIYAFDISLHVPVSELPAVRVNIPNYKRDSIQNRLDYAKAFNFRKPGIGISSGQGGAGVGLDLDEFINIFRFRHNKHMLAFQQRLEQEEIDKAIDHRFTKATVRKVTGLTGDSLTTFMKIFRPSYQFTQLSSDYEFLEYIKLASEAFRNPEEGTQPNSRQRLWDPKNNVNH